VLRRGTPLRPRRTPLPRTVVGGMGRANERICRGRCGDRSARASAARPLHPELRLRAVAVCRIPPCHAATLPHIVIGGD
jgi:hypothetical protein